MGPDSSLVQARAMSFGHEPRRRRWTSPTSGLSRCWRLRLIRRPMRKCIGCGQVSPPTGGGLGSTPRQTEWSGPSAWPVVPKAEGPDVQGTYLANFDAVVSEMTAAGGPIAAAMSGGLDSSFVVAALAMQTTPDRPVHAFSHAPHPDAQLEPSGDWDPDDSTYAMAMQRAYPGLVIVHRVINADLVASLDAASDAARRSWLPTFNPGNQVWISQIERLAAELGASRLFSGTNGNPAFAMSRPTRSAIT